MKKRTLLLTAVTGMGYLVFCSNSAGPASVGFDCTGAEAAGVAAFVNPTGCSAPSSSCHGSVGSSSSTTTVALELDSSGVATTHYRPGKSYTIKITGSNSSGTSLPKYGFQVNVLKGTASGTTNADAGTLATTGLPASTHVIAPGANTQLTVFEHSAPISITGTTFTQTIAWTAPATNVGSITIWGAANFVIGGTPVVVSPSDKWNTNHAQIDIWPSALDAINIVNDLTISAFPNPSINNLYLQLSNAQPGAYTLNVFNMNGSVITTQNMEVSNAIQSANINTSNWSVGLYNVVIEKDGNIKSLIVVKQ